MSTSVVLYDAEQTVGATGSFYWNKGSNFLTLSGVKEVAIQLNFTIGTSITGVFSLQLSCDGVNWADYKVGGTLVKEDITATGTYIIALETPCLYIKPKLAVSAISGDSTVQFYVNGKD